MTRALQATPEVPDSTGSDHEGDAGTPVSARLGQAPADVATIGILQQRSIDHAQIVAEQLRTVRNSRVTIEQAKGMIAAHSGTLTPEQAFTALRGYARSHRRRLADLARDIIDRTADITTHGASEVQHRKSGSWFGGPASH